VSISFTNIYITQPVLPVLEVEFAVDTVIASFSVSAVLLGIAISNLPSGALADRLPIHPIILTGGIVLAVGALICALANDIWVLIGARFLQGLFIPAMTTCLAAYLAKTLPLARLNVVMGTYVSATVLGGMGSRLLGGWIHPPLHWRYAFVTTAILVLIATFIAVRELPRTPVDSGRQQETIGFLALLRRWELLLIFLVAAAGQSIFSPVFNYLPYRLSTPPFELPTELVTLVYLVYIVGIFMGPAAGRISNRFGNGYTITGGAVVLGISLVLILLPTIVAVVLGLIGVCAGFFAIHAAAVGSLNRKLTSGHGRANALYVLFYYVGAWLGITWAGFAYKQGGWNALVYTAMLFLTIPLYAGIHERRIAKHKMARELRKQHKPDH
jgi:YNFM family putative membrane transporter